MKLSINKEEESWEIYKYIEMTQHTLGQQMGHRKKQKGNQKYIKTSENASTTFRKSVRRCESSRKREVYRSTPGVKEEESQGNTLTLHLKELYKEEQTKPTVSRRAK